jgi:hypothetical protein
VEWGFELNPYNFCVANKMVDGKQCTVVWHVDDLKISHVDPKVVTTILNLLDGRYGQEIVGGKWAPLTVTQRKIHDYLGMTLDYSEEGAVKIDMRDYVKKSPQRNARRYGWHCNIACRIISLPSERRNRTAG